MIIIVILRDHKAYLNYISVNLSCKGTAFNTSLSLGIKDLLKFTRKTAARRCTRRSDSSRTDTLAIVMAACSFSTHRPTETLQMIISIFFFASFEKDKNNISGISFTKTTVKTRKLTCAVLLVLLYLHGCPPENYTCHTCPMWSPHSQPPATNHKMTLQRLQRAGRLKT